MHYQAYITRDGKQVEVVAELYEHGKVEMEYDDWLQVIEDPVFYRFCAEDDEGMDVILTPKELFEAEEQMLESYWGEYL